MVFSYCNKAICLRLWIAAIVAGVGAAGKADMPSEAELQQVMREALTAPSRKETSEDRRRLAQWLIVEPERAHWNNGKLQWAVRRKKKMTADERLETLSALDRYLRHALANTPGAHGAALFDEAEADRVVDQSELSIAAQPYLWELTDKQLRDAFDRAMNDPKLAEQVNKIPSTFQTPEVGGRALDLVLESGTLTWRLVPKDQNPRFGGNPQQVMSAVERMNRRNTALAQQHSRDLEQFLRIAVGSIDAPDLGMPLLDPDDAATIPIRIGAQQIMFAAARGAAGVGTVKSSASRAAVLRTFSDLQLSNGQIPTEIWRPEPDLLAMNWTPVGEPQIVIDTGAFTGAVVNKLAFSPDGRLLAAGGDVVRVWDTASGQLLHTLRGRKSSAASGGCTDLTFTPDGRQLLVTVSGFDESLRVYDLAAVQEIREVHAGHEGHIERLAISRDGKWLATYGVDRRLQIWDWPARKIVASNRSDEPIDHLSFPSPSPILLLITSTGRYDWMQVQDRKRVRLTDREILERRLSSRTQWPGGGAPHPFCIDVNWAQTELLIAGYSRQANHNPYWCGLWSLADPEPRFVHNHPYNVTACSLSPHGSMAASADALGNVHIWSTSDGQLLHDFATRTAAIYSARYDVDAGELDFGRRPFPKGPKGQWKLNHYSPLSETFHFQQRRVSERDESEPPAAVLDLNGYALRLADKQLKTWRHNRPLASLSFTDALKMQPLCFSMLGDSELGIPNAVVLGSEDGSLVCLDPETLISLRTFLGHTDRVWCVSQADDRLLVSASADGTVSFWQLEPPRPWGNLAVLADADGRVHKVFPNTPTADHVAVDDFILSIDWQPLSALRQQMATGDNWPFDPGRLVRVELQRGRALLERNIKLSKTGDTARPLLSFFVSRDAKDWVIWTPEGYYDASPGGQRMVGWHINHGAGRAAEFLPIENFRDRYYDPRLINRLLQKRNLQLALKVGEDNVDQPPGKKPNVIQPIAELRTKLHQPPRIKITSPGSERITGSAEIEIVAEVTSPKEHPVRSVSVLVNGRPTFAAVDNAQVPAVVRCKVPLNAGRNEICVAASNDVAHARSSSVWVDFRQAVAGTVPRRLFVLAVGISNYKDPRFNLKYASRDAEAFAQACERQQGFYDCVKVKVVKDHEATETRLKNEMDWLVKNVERNDVAMFFIAGHGVMELDNYYIATHEMDPDGLRGSCLHWGIVRSVARDLRGTMVMFADTCHAGGIAGLQNTGGDKLHELTHDDVGAIVYAACGRHEVSFENPGWEHGGFTKALLDILNSPDSDLDNPPDGKLSVKELDFCLDRAVTNLTGKRQRPVSQNPPMLPDFDLFILP